MRSSQPGDVVKHLLYPRWEPGRVEEASSAESPDMRHEAQLWLCPPPGPAQLPSVYRYALQRLHCHCPALSQRRQGPGERVIRVVGLQGMPPPCHQPYSCCTPGAALYPSGLRPLTHSTIDQHPFSTCCMHSLVLGAALTPTVQSETV